MVTAMYVEINGKWEHAIGIWPNGDFSGKPCGFIPLGGLSHFWEALGVREDAEEKLQPEWIKGNLVPVAPEYPVLSWLIQMQIDNSWVKAEDIPALLREVDIGRANCIDPQGMAVFEALKTCATLALAQSNGIALSPF
ncbi:MAG TPA: hypothetical protein VG267_16615 [Terracidiphilus sp.]|jgi:hypothetical protein|nr:hypothetical protein [Terracidiphilus sp.]